jgi:hypothetical protein
MTGLMRKLHRIYRLCWRTLLLVTSLGCASLAQADATTVAPNAATRLHARFAELGQQLGNNQFGRPLYLDSTESSTQARGDIYALVDYPFATVNRALNDPLHWCDVMILHLNTKSCLASPGPAGGTLLVVHIGKKSYQELGDAYPVEFARSIASTPPSPAYFDIVFNAKTGPLGTRDYRLQLEAIPAPGDKTFIHLSYSYTFNLQGRLAMLAYLSTLGRDKVGFTDLVGGMRGAVERNTMRYYLAIDAYLGALSTPPAGQFEKRLQDWFTATERYARQLHEVERGAYLDMKRHELLRMQKSPKAPG